MGENSSEEDGRLGVEYLRQLANFYYEILNKSWSPQFSDITRFFWGTSEPNYDQYYNDKTREFLSNYNNNCKSKIVEYYLKLFKLAEQNMESRNYLNVYEPLIEIVERGGSFNLSRRKLEIKYICSIPLGNWFDIFFKADKQK